MSDTKTNKSPVAQFRIGLVTASVWENKTDKGTFYKITNDNRFKDKDGNWRSTDSYSVEDALAKNKVTDLAINRILELQAAAE